MQYPGQNWQSTVTDAAMNPMQVTGTHSPHVKWSEREFGDSPLFKSHRDTAIILDKMVAPGFGHLPAGLVMSIFPDGVRKGVMYPSDFAGVPLAAAVTASATKFKVAAAQAPFFTVGDKISVGDKNTKETVTIVDIVVTGATAEITVGTAFGSAYDTTKHAHPAGFGNPVFGILEQSVFSDNDGGAYGTVVLSNCVLYKQKLLNDPQCTALKTALPTTVVDGLFVILK